MLLIDPQTPTTLYAVAHGAIVKSIDGGTTWTAATSNLSIDDAGNYGITSLVIDPRNPNTLYAGNGLISGGVFQTTDGGENWTAVDSGLRFNPVMALAIDPRNGTLLGAYPGPGTRYPYRSRRSAR